MATKRTDAFDVYASEKKQRDADMRALKLMSPHSTLKGMGRRVAPLGQAARGTVPPPISIQDEALIAAETAITHNPLFAEDLVAQDLLAEEILAEQHLHNDDMIELIEESGLLVLDPDQAPDDAIEVSSSFLIEDLDGFPAGIKTPDSAHGMSALGDDIEEITSDHLAYVETRGEIVEVDRPRLPAVTRSADEIPVINRHNLYNQHAEYSDGVPRIAAHARGLSSKTLRVPAPRSKTSSGWLRKAAVGVVFVAGIGAGIAFAMHSNSETAPVHSASAELPVAAASAPAPEPEPAVEETLPVEAEVIAAPVVAQLDEAEAQEALDVAASLEPTVQPLDVEGLDLEGSESADVTDPVESGPVVKALPMEASIPVINEPVIKTVTKKKPAARTKSKSATKPPAQTSTAGEANKEAAKKVTTAAIISTGKATTADPGVLMLAAKPPCEIRIDGKTTGLRTPQRVLKLAPGKHRITLTNQEHQIKDSFKVSIVSGQKTRIVRDNTSKIK